MTMGALHESSQPAEPMASDPSANAVSTPPTAFGKYQLFASLGRGGMADVFLSVARGPLGFNKLAVIKRLKQSLAEEPAFRSMFLDEARLAARLNHPNIVHTYEVGEHNGIYFIAMEYLEGQSLNKVIKEGLKRKELMPHAVAARVIADALAGLAHAHELRDYDGSPLSIIHRDVSPHNIFVTYDGHVKLVDFGIAKAALSTQETEVGVLKGKVGYMSPEQAMGQTLDARADIFPMGIVLWEMLAGKRLMAGESAAQTLHKLVNEPIARIGDVVPIDPELALIVDRSLQKDVTIRFQSATEMREALEAYVRRVGGAHEGEVGRRMINLFGGIREEVQRQIQKHMTVITTAANTQELQALNADALKNGGRMSARLMRLGVGNGSGSGVVSNYPPAGGSTGSVLNAPPTPSGKWNMVALALAIAAAAAGLFALTAMLYYLRKQPTNAGTVPTSVPSEPVHNGGPPIPTGSLASLPPAIPTTTAAPIFTSPIPSITALPTAEMSTSVRTSTPPRNPITNPRIGPTTRVPVVPTASATGPAIAVTDEKPGAFQVQANPAARVTVDGRDYGFTPARVSDLKPGTHSVTLTSYADPTVKKSFSVTIESGATLSRSYSLP